MIPIGKFLLLQWKRGRKFHRFFKKTSAFSVIFFSLLSLWGYLYAFCLQTKAPHRVLLITYTGKRDKMNPQWVYIFPRHRLLDHGPVDHITVTINVLCLGKKNPSCQMQVNNFTFTKFSDDDENMKCHIHYSVHAKAVRTALEY